MGVQSGIQNVNGDYLLLTPNIKELKYMNSKELNKKEKRKDKRNLEFINNNLPEQCKNCSFFIITNITDHKIYCPYMIKDKCILK